MQNQLKSLKDFGTFSEQSLAAIDACKQKRTPILGVYCIYAPAELIRAAGAVPIGLCGKKQAPIPAAEEVLPAALCPLIKSSFGYAKTNTCPYFDMTDALLAETTCDGKKKMYEFMGRLKPLHLMHLPHTGQGPGALAYWRDAQNRLEDFLEELTGRRATDEALQREIALGNRMRTELLAIARLAAAPGSPVMGLDLLPVMESTGFVTDMPAYISRLQALHQELEQTLAATQQPDNDPRRPRVLLTGTPLGKGCEKTLRLLEEEGAHVVAMDNCTGLKGLDLPVDETGDPRDAIARRYLSVPCSCMTPNTGRLDFLERLRSEFAVDAVVDSSWLGCHTYNVEAQVIKEWSDSVELPFLHLETDYSESDTEQMRTRIEAFLELLD